MRQRLVFAALLALATLVLIVVFAWPGRAPWSPQRTHELPLAEFESSTSRISLIEHALTEHTLRAEGADARGATQLVQALPELPASDFRYFRFDVDELATVSKLVLSWQGSEGKGSAALPEAPFGRATLDLSRVPAWRGTIHSLAIVASPTDYLAASVAPPSPFVLRRVRLESTSLSAALSALWTQWTAYRPWTGRSNNTGGMELGSAGASLQAFAALWLACALLLTALCLGRERARTLALPLIVGASLLLAGWQLFQLGARARVARAAAEMAQPAAPLAAQPQLAQAAHRLSDRLPRDASRVLVFGPDRFLSEYSTWLLRTRNVATLPAPDSLPAQAALGGAVLVLVGQGDWEYAADTRDLRLGAQHRVADLEADVGVMKAYRFEAGTP